MDPITQGALGAACSQALLYHKTPKNAWFAGAIGAMAPDLDFLIRSPSDPLLSLIYHRHFTHSFIFIPIGTTLVFLFLMLFKRFRQDKKLTFFAIFIGFATHALLDACTSYGTLLLWPFTNQRFAWDIISIIDIGVTLPLLVGVIWTQKNHSPKSAWLGLFLAGCFLIFSGFQHHRAIQAVKDYALTHHLNLTRIRAFPALARNTLWRVVAQQKNKLFLADVNAPLLYAAQLKNPEYYPLFRPSQLPQYVFHHSQQLRDFKVYQWFTNNYLIAVNQQPLVLVDARYLWGSHPKQALWGIQFQQNKPHVKKLRNINLKKILFEEHRL